MILLLILLITYITYNLIIYLDLPSVIVALSFLLLLLTIEKLERIFLGTLLSGVNEQRPRRVERFCST